MAQYLYDTPGFINIVKSYPTIWDKSTPSYKDTHARQAAWIEVCRRMHPHFDFWTENQRQILINTSTVKWHQIRDAFVETLRRKSGVPSITRFIHHDCLLFLLKDQNEYEYAEIKIEPDEPSELNQPTELHANEGTSDEMNTEHTNGTDIKCEIRNKIVEPVQNKNKRKLDDTVDEVLNKKSPVMNENEAFFHSVMPSVTDMTEDENLDFRMRVLQLIQQIKRRRSVSSVSGTKSCSNLKI